MKKNKLRILLADDHKIVRDGLRLLIDGQPDMLVVGEAANGKEALRKARCCRDGSLNAGVERASSNRAANNDLSPDESGCPDSPRGRMLPEPVVQSRRGWICAQTVGG